MSLADRLRRLSESLPAEGAVVLTRTDLLELLADADDGLAVDLSTSQVAALLGLSDSAVRRLLDADELRGYKRPGGSTWYVPAVAVADYRQQHEHARPVLRAVPVRRRGSA